MSKYKSFLAILLVMLAGCYEKKADDLMWLSDDRDSAFIQIERHFRGFDLAMKEVGDRYSNIFSAVNDDNWGYAIYNLTKLKTAIVNGLERRPNRKLSAQSFLNYSIPALMKTLKSKEREKFLNEFELFKQSCNNCHISEKVEYVNVILPQLHSSIVGR